MKSFKTQSLALILSVFALYGCQQSSAEIADFNKDKISEELVKLTNRWVDAMNTRDRKKLDDILSDELVFHLSNGELWGKEQLLKSHIEDRPVYEETGIYDLEVHVYSKHLAVVTGKAKWITKNNDGVTDERSVWSNLFRKEGNDWKCIFGMGSELADN